MKWVVFVFLLAAIVAADAAFASYIGVRTPLDGAVLGVTNLAFVIVAYQYALEFPRKGKA